MREPDVIDAVVIEFDAARRPPDFAVVDVRMPEMTGIEFLRVVRSYLRLQDLPVLMVTASRDPVR